MDLQHKEEVLKCLKRNEALYQILYAQNVVLSSLSQEKLDNREKRGILKICIVRFVIKYKNLQNIHISSLKTLEGEIIEEKPLTDFKIIMEDGHSKEETISYLKNGVLVFDKEEFIENFNSYMIEWCFDRRRIEKLKKMIDTGVPIRNWGIVTKNGKTYYIRYTCLERGKVILK